MMFKKISLFGSAAASFVLLAACNGTTTDGVIKTPQTTPTTTTPTTTVPAVPLPTGLVTAGVAASPVAVLTLDQGNLTTGTVNPGVGSQYDHTPTSVTVNGTAVAVSGQAIVNGTSSGIVVPTGRRYVGTNANPGSQNRIVALETAAADLPSSNQPLSFSGKANVVAIDATNNANTALVGMDATITANFGSNDVDVSLTQGANTITINDLAIAGSRFAHSGTSTANVSAIGAAAAYVADNNNPAVGSVSASGVFAGPNAAELGAVAIIQKGVNSDQALITLTGGQ